MNSHIESFSSDSVQIEIDVKKLTYLFSSGYLCAADLRCLNRASKERVWSLCLKSCAKRAGCSLTEKRFV